jgi:hypothetical protein
LSCCSYRKRRWILQDSDGTTLQPNGTFPSHTSLFRFAILGRRLEIVDSLPPPLASATTKGTSSSSSPRKSSTAYTVAWPVRITSVRSSSIRIPPIRKAPVRTCAIGRIGCVWRWACSRIAKSAAATSSGPLSHRSGSIKSWHSKHLLPQVKHC